MPRMPRPFQRCAVCLWVVATNVLADEPFDAALRELREASNEQPYAAIVDFSRPSSDDRFFVVRRSDGEIVFQAHVAHGEGSDPDNLGRVVALSNTSGTGASSVGLYALAERYEGRFGPSMRLDGLAATNSAARGRAIVLHAASYMEPALRARNGGQYGRSCGCFALTQDDRDRAFAYLETGSLMSVVGPPDVVADEGDLPPATCADED